MSIKGAIVPWKITSEVISVCEYRGIDVVYHDPSVLFKNPGPDTPIELDCLTEHRDDDFCNVVRDIKDKHGIT